MLFFLKFSIDRTSKPFCLSSCEFSEIESFCAEKIKDLAIYIINNLK